MKPHSFLNMNRNEKINFFLVLSTKNNGILLAFNNILLFFILNQTLVSGLI